MKSLSLILLLSFGAAAQVPVMNFNAETNDATICNTTNNEPIDTNAGHAQYGQTPFLALFHAIGCAGVTSKQTEICNKQVVQAGQCASYHFKWGTTSRGGQVCVPAGHGGAKDKWNCGAIDYRGHLIFDLSNDDTANVSHLVYSEIFHYDKNYAFLDGNVNIYKH